MKTTSAAQLSFEERIAILVDREELFRTNRQSINRIKAAKLKENAMIVDIDWQHPRKLDRQLMMSLCTCQWIKEHQNIAFTGKTGTGKTWLACALAYQACLEGFSSRFLRVPRLLGELKLAKADGSYDKLLGKLAKYDLIILDDWGQSLVESERRDILEIIEDRTGCRSTIITTQLPVEKWPEVIGDPTIADSIMDRFVHRAHPIKLSGDSLRPKYVNKTRAKSESKNEKK